MTDLLLTKLHPPPLPVWWIPRAGVERRLDAGRQGPITLVSAPAGYGKSVSVAAWLGSRDEPHAWLSLDPADDEPRTFLAYLVAAVRGIFPEACAETQALIDAPRQAPASTLARSLTNELEGLGEPFILVLDDYQAIRETTVHDLLAELLAHPPPCLHLIVITRRDPPLPLASLRGRGQLTDVGIRELRFDRPECDLFLKHATGSTLGERSCAHLHEILEGWPAGLQLVSLALRTRKDPEAFALDLRGATHEVQEYLVREVLAGLSRAEGRWLLETSVLDRFCASLCDAVCSQEAHGLDPGLDGDSFLRALRTRALFAIPLDEKRVWYRYHHLFQEALRERLASARGPEEIAALHARAARWLADNELPGEGILHALAAGDQVLARDLVLSNRNHLVNTEHWGRLDRWLTRLPEALVADDPALLAAQAWACEYAHRSCAAQHLLDAGELLALQPASYPDRRAIEGEIESLRALHELDLCHAEKALTCAERGIADLSAESLGMEGYCRIVKALAHQSRGELERALDALRPPMGSHPPSEAYRSLLLTGETFVYWQAGDLDHVKQSALEVLRIGEDLGLEASISYARYLLGILHYVRDEWAEAGRNLEAMLELRYFAPRAPVYHGAFALSLLRIGEQRIEEARTVLEAASQDVIESSSPLALELVHAFEAEFALRTGRPAKALQWARTFGFDPVRELYMFYIPQLTLAKAWLADAGPDGVHTAAGMLDRLLDLDFVAHNVPVRIQALSLRALAHAAEGDETAALEPLTEALRLGEPGGFVRPFVDLGAPMASLMERLPEAVSGSELVGRIRAAPGAGAPVPDGRRASAAVLSEGSGVLVEPLTNRELDVLELLAERLRDKEIAAKLYISPVTVKSHLKGIYRKLDVRDRRQAVARSRELGILGGA